MTDNKQLAFSSDEPITSQSDDLLGRTEFANRIENMLCAATPSSTPLVLGLYGPWGSGKTSVINLVAEHIEDCEGVVAAIRFEPWNYLSTSQLIEQFFQGLSQSLKMSKRKSDAALEAAEALVAYSQALFSSGILAAALQDGTIAVGTAVTAISGTIISRAIKRRSKTNEGITKRRDELAKKMSALDGRIVVFIDDIDRLPDEHIRMMFQLIASLAKLPNVSYLLAFDEDIVASALSKVQAGTGREYLEKIVQVPIRLPNPPREDLHQILLEEINNLFSDFGYADDDVDIKRWSCIWNIMFTPRLKTLRQAKRYTNALRARLLSSPPTASFLDLVTLVNLELFASDCVTWIGENKEALCGSYSSSLLTGVNQAQMQEKLLIRLRNELKETDAEWALEVLCIMFPRIANETGKVFRSFDRTGDLNGIWRSDSFDMYFETNADDGIDAHEVRDVCYQCRPEQFLAVFEKYATSGQAIRFISAVHEHVKAMPVNRVKLVCDCMMSVLGVSGEIRDRGFGQTTADEEIVRTCESCYERLGPEDSGALIKEAVHREGCRIAFPLALFLMWQIGAVKTSNGNGAKQLISENVLHEICDTVCDLSEQANQKGALFDYQGGDYALALYKEYRPSEYISFARKLVSSSKINAVQFVASNCGKFKTLDFKPSSFRFDSSRFEEILPLDAFGELIDEARLDSKFFELDEETQLVAASFSIFRMKPGLSEIEADDARQLLNAWRKELFEPEAEIEG